MVNVGEVCGDQRQRDALAVESHGEGEVGDKLELSFTVVTMAGLPRRIVKVGHLYSCLSITREK